LGLQAFVVVAGPDLGLAEVLEHEAWNEETPLEHESGKDQRTGTCSVESDFVDQKRTREKERETGFPLCTRLEHDPANTLLGLTHLRVSTAQSGDLFQSLVSSSLDFGFTLLAADSSLPLRWGLFCL
jgi:hypothetical protein